MDLACTWNLRKCLYVKFISLSDNSRLPLFSTKPIKSEKASYEISLTIFKCHGSDR